MALVGAILALASETSEPAGKLRLESAAGAVAMDTSTAG